MKNDVWREIAAPEDGVVACFVWYAAAPGAGADEAEALEGVKTRGGMGSMTAGFVPGRISRWYLNLWLLWNPQ